MQDDDDGQAAALGPWAESRAHLACLTLASKQVVSGAFRRPETGRRVWSAQGRRAADSASSGLGNDRAR
jgi:hypothetical protein